MNRKIRFAVAALAAVVSLGTVAGNVVYAADSVSITNVSLRNFIRTFWFWIPVQEERLLLLLKMDRGMC